MSTLTSNRVTPDVYQSEQKGDENEMGSHIKLLREKEGVCPSTPSCSTHQEDEISSQEMRG